MVKDPFGQSYIYPRPRTFCAVSHQSIFLISFRGTVMKEIKKIGLAARLTSMLRAFFCPPRRTVRIYILRPDLMFHPTPAQEKHLRWQRFLLQQELRRHHRWHQRRLENLREIREQNRSLFF